MNNPYPGYPPNYRVVPQIGNYIRTCLVIELLSQDKLNDLQLTQIRERLEATIQNAYAATIERCDVVTANRFDRSLRDGLRLP
jgi:hypothetical protein